MRPLHRLSRSLPSLLLLLHSSAGLSSPAHSTSPAPPAAWDPLRCLDPVEAAASEVWVEAPEPLLLQPLTESNFSWFRVGGGGDGGRAVDEAPWARPLLPGDGRLREAGGGALWVDSSGVGDSGVYAAVGQQGGQQQQAAECFNVTVFVRPPGSCLTPQLLLEGRPAFVSQSYSVYCSSLLSQLAPDGLLSITWLKDCKPVDRGHVLGSSLLIPRVVVADEGNFSCVADFRRFNRTWRVSRTRRIHVFSECP
ncbi:uncharacterized protein LOC144954068, partial [Lampetra fluviatilis]